MKTAIRKAIALILSKDAELLNVLGTTARMSLSSSLVALLIGVPLGILLGTGRFKGKGALSVINRTFMAMPPVVCGLLFYILFYFVFRFSKKHKVVILFSATCLYCLLCAALGLASPWYEAILCFPLGVAYANYKDKVHSVIFKSKLKTIFLFLIFLCAFILLLLFSTKLSFSSLLKMACKMASAIAFVWVATIFVLVININNPITRFLGKISLEIYLLQGIFLNLFKNQIYIENDILYILAVTVCTLILAMLAHPVYKAIGKLHFKKTV